MTQIHWSPDHAEAFLGAMKRVALAGRSDFEPIEREILEATQRHVLHSDFDLDDLPTLSPEALAQRLPSANEREQVLEFLILLPYAPMEVDASKVAEVDAFASALDIAPVTLTDLHRVRDHRLRTLQFDYGRRGTVELLPGKGYTGKIKSIFEAIRQTVGSEEVANRYRALEKLPEGSLGHTFFRFYRERGFPLPGERGSFTEFLAPHDLTHILAGCNTDMKGEIDVAGFEAAMSGRPFGFELLLEVILDFHLGWAFTTAGLFPPAKGQLDPETLMAAYERGAGCKLDLMKGWDWWGVIDEPVLALRERYGIRGAGDEILLPAPPEQAANAAAKATP